MHRLFFALAPDPHVLARIAHAAQALPAAGGRRTRPDKLHLTLAFLGDAPPDAALRAGARTAAAVPAFEFALGEADSFHGGTWILRAPPAPFAPLHAALARELHGAGLRVHDEGRAFVPHVTLYRSAGERLPRAPIEPIPWPARVLHLYDSNLGSGSYTLLGEWPLASAPG